MSNEMKPQEITAILKVLEKVSFCDAAHEAHSCAYEETGCSDCEWQTAKNKIQDVFRQIVAGELKPVIHERWLSEEGEDGLAKCPVCHKLRLHDNYCSNCGTQMDKPLDGKSLNGKDDNNAG